MKALLEQLLYNGRAILRDNRQENAQPDSDKSNQRRRLEALEPERRAQLLDPAEVAFASAGFEGASLNQILAAAQMSKGQAYYYIADKADLYRAVIDRALKRLADEIDDPFSDPVTADIFWAQIADFFEQLTRVLHRNKRLAALARGIYEGPATQAALAEPIARLHSQLERLVSRGQKVAAVRNDVPRTLIVAALFGVSREIDGWFARHWSELSAVEALRLNDKAIAMIAAMASPPPPGKPNKLSKPAEGTKL